LLTFDGRSEQDVADEDHLRLLRSGTEKWNEGRPDLADLAGADLTGADLVGANLTNTILTGVNLTNAQLRNANLTNPNLIGLNPSNAYVYGTGLTNANLTNADLTDANLTQVNLTDAQLHNANLTNALLHFANLTGAELIGANLTNANLTNALLHFANLTGAELIGANLTGAQLHNANLAGAQLTGANLSNADIHSANLTRADVTNADVTNAGVGWTLFTSLDLRSVVGLESLRHLGPSSVGIDSLYLSDGHLPSAFLRGCGVPEMMIDYAPSLTATEAFASFSCFVSYGHANSAFANRLHNDLFNNHQIRCWLDVHQLVPGDKLDQQIDQAIRSADKILLICSREVLAGPTGGWWVDREIGRALQREEQVSRERNETVTIVIPIIIDDFLFSPDCTYHRAADLKERLAANLIGWDTNDAVYERGLQGILRALRVQRPPFFGASQL
jgi:uncharacterized protein YjbI with pentapeptide repeats